MEKKLSEREIFDHVFNKNRLDKKSLKVLEEDPKYRELMEYYEFLKEQLSQNSTDDVAEIAKIVRKRIDPAG